MGVWSYLLRRLVQVPLVLLLVTVIIFALMKVTPGDPITIMLGPYATPETKAALELQYHLNEPLPVQYFMWVWELLHGDLGSSIRSKERIVDLVVTRFPVSLTLAGISTLVSVLIAIPAGVFAAYRKNSWWDYLLMGSATIGLSIPTFTLGLLLILVFALKLHWVPISGIGLRSASDGLWPLIQPYILPIAALAAGSIGELARVIRASMLEVFDQDYIRTARAEGMSDMEIIRIHALKNALIPVITVIAITFAFQVGNTLTVEYLFSIPGLGSALIAAVINRDFPVIQGLSLVVGLVFIVTNLLADVSYVIVDPRVRLS